MKRDEHMAAPQALVSVNGVAHAIADGESLAALLARLGHAPEQLATAVNGDFVARSTRHERLLQGGDHITCFQAIVGG